MKRLSGTWTSAELIVALKRICDVHGDVRPVLAADADTAPHLPHLDRLLARLEAGDVVGNALDAQIAALIERLGLLDASGDQGVGGMWRVGQGAAMLSEEEDLELSQGLRAFVAVLEEGGVNKLTRARYDRIGGEAVERAARVSAEARAAMERVVIGGKTLAAYFDGWVAQAEELSALEAKRRELEAARSDAPQVTALDLLRLRQEGTRRLNRLLEALEDSGIAEAERRRIAAPLVGQG